MTSVTKSIVFPEEVVDAIDRELSKNKLRKTNFSDFVRDAAIDKLEELTKPKENISKAKK